MTSLAWQDDELAATHDPEQADRLVLTVDGRRIGSIVTYPSSPAAWQRIHGYGPDEVLWSFDIELDDPGDRGLGFGSRAVRRTCEAVLARRGATRMVVDALADNPRAIAAYEKAGFHKVRFLADHDDGDGDRGDAWLMELRPGATVARTRSTSVHYFKYDGSEHWRIEADLVREDSHGRWLRGYPGSRTWKAGELSTTERVGFVFLVPHDDWWAGFWNLNRSGPYELYVDSATPATWRDDELQLVDLDLDVVRRWDRTVTLLDEDEFEDHSVRYGYPPDVRAAALDAARRVQRAVERGDPPFDLFDAGERGWP